ncbi:MAG: threonylcarbamoyl-AMP synthase [Lachnospiraceae bacterium]|nr:threonylcarbamoyl-AMP synthase [Lachnospiraceae bacterium]MCI8996855.1 threonylcarbamoyl-AMP synthase [Lachnospiraceae bacterium]MCI9134939.1 threonylcarbamoyl-AMP synthase [Lachnospiraceae bacterium]
METRLVKLDYKNPDIQALAEAGEILRQGGLVAFPTETVYGLGGDALNPQASRNIYAAKGRPSDNPLIVHIAELSSLEEIAREISGEARGMIEAFWPGPLTLIFQKTDRVPPETTGGLSTVAVRMPSDLIAAGLIRAGGGFVAAPSANVSGRPSTTTAAHVMEDLGGRIQMILDGGQAVIGLESTIVDVSGEKPVILRPGVITRKMLETVAGEMTVDPALIAPDSDIRPKAPGMKYRHYAPRAELTVVEGEQEMVTERINALVREWEQQGGKAGIIATEESRERYPEGLVKCVGSRLQEEQIAAHLYEVLREFDESEVTRIYSESFGDASIGAAIMNRLMKAAGQHVIHV